MSPAYGPSLVVYRSYNLLTVSVARTVFASILFVSRDLQAILLSYASLQEINWSSHCIRFGDVAVAVCLNHCTALFGLFSSTFAYYGVVCSLNFKIVHSLVSGKTLVSPTS